MKKKDGILCTRMDWMTCNESPMLTVNFLSRSDYFMCVCVWVGVSIVTISDNSSRFRLVAPPIPLQPGSDPRGPSRGASRALGVTSLCSALGVLLASLLTLQHAQGGERLCTCACSVGTAGTVATTCQPQVVRERIHLLPFRRPSH